MKLRLLIRRTSPFIGNLSPDALADLPRPWYWIDADSPAPSTSGKFGDIVPQEAFYAILKQADVLDPPLVELSDEGQARLNRFSQEYPALVGIASADASGKADNKTPRRDRIRVDARVESQR